ncbi:MAG: methylenetetrahydrofolate reductase [NAD(P)H] [Loktanella sp.]|jgi:methylenetetrahydrofolate reductase (NADPH)|nr:methylenetetrahydrofolate reductase [NAD(P)H] [Loktanella sp.]MDO7606837.1 methylenetetrahydrofolate reductase [NAD(P)H] [Loktanella sp.]MDO7624188.1 methylenetetrahydrofolate reductase [NAD(P)H] [Loktanella sp.]MDO7625848.1 methylenetetrahydrofolate reductase [NAD(P)H] [Loktanella sp.]MDO7630957.1 methylenetetrahydrofolate reductase [NAD(P)H] [Loktanella sp.]
MTRPALSFEFFPPKDLPGSFRLWDAVQNLAPLNPDFVSVTYGAGGTTRKLTHEAVTTLTAQSGLRVAGHLTCVDASREETLKIANEYAAVGVKDIVALRGDAPKGSAGFAPKPNGFQNSIELISALSDTGNFNIRVGAYPEKHPEATSQAADIAYLKRKFDAGATGAITQFFFEADTYFRFRDACAAAGITAPIIPGILPIENWDGVQRFAAQCGTHIPQVIADGFRNAMRDGTETLLATALAAELCDDLLQGGVEHLHFYTLNRGTMTRNVLHALGYTAERALQNVA